jgi:hypothetical protein
LDIDASELVPDVARRRFGDQPFEPLQRRGHLGLDLLNMKRPDRIAPKLRPRFRSTAK